MDVLVVLCERAGTVVSTEELLQLCWGSTLHGDNPIHKTITQLRRVLGDSATEPRFIETIRKRGYRTVAEVGIDGPAGAPAAGSWLAGSPFRGLQAFDADHAAIFFGRKELTAALALALCVQVQAGRALQLVLGPSGSGKTSIIRAGLLPALAQGDYGLEVQDSAMIDLGELHEGQLFAGLGGAMLDWQCPGAGGGVDLFAGFSAYSLGQLLESDAGAVVALLEQALGQRAAAARLVLVIDRFEAVFAQPHMSEQQRHALVLALDTLARSSRVVLIVACRNDFYPRIAEYPALLEGKGRGAHFDLVPPSHAEIAQIIGLPALAANLTFGTDPHTHERLDAVLCRAAAASPDALPLLQYTLQELYRLRSADGELGVEAYRQMGGLDGVLGARAEAVVAALGPALRAALGRVLSLLVTVSADDDRLTSRRAPWASLTVEAERELVTALVEARLFVAELVGGEAGFGIAHEALLRRWPRVGQWVAEHRDGLRTRARVAQLSARWVEHGRPADLLLPHGKQLDEARAMLAGAQFSLTAQDVELIGASARKATRRERFRLGALALIAALVVLASAAGVSALRDKQVALQRRGEAEGLMGFMLSDFADKLRPLARLDLLDDVSAKALEYLSVSDGDALSAASLTHRAKALEVIGEVRIARGDPKAALDALQAAHAILDRQLGAAPRDAALLKQIGANAFWLGNLRFDQGEWASSLVFLTQYRDYADRLSVLAPADVDAWIEQSYAHNSLGSLALKRGDARAAAAEFDLSIALKNKAVASKPHDRVLAKDLADSLSWAGSVNEVMGRLDAAQALYVRQLQLAQGLHDTAPNEALWSDKLAEALQHQAKLNLMRGDERTAREQYQRAEALLQANSASEPGNRIWQAKVGVVQLAMLRIAPEVRDLGGELAQLDVLGKKIASLTEIDPKNATWAKQQAQVWLQIASAQLDAGRAVAALGTLTLAQERLQTRLSRNKADILARVILANAMLVRADIALKANDKALARQSWQGVADLLGPQAFASDDFRVLDPWIRSQVCMDGKGAASAAILRLSRMGYREQAYMKFLSLHN